jgi:hypothetical protein
MTTIAQEVDEFGATDYSSGPLPLLPDHLVDELAQILADALHEDLKEYPNYSDIPAVVEPTVVSRRGSDRKSRPRSRSKVRKVAPESGNHNLRVPEVLRPSPGALRPPAG